MQMFKDCYYNYEDGRFTVGNAKIERTWLITREGGCKSVSLRNKTTEDEWLDATASEPSFQLPMMGGGDAAVANIAARVDDDMQIAAPHLLVSFTMMVHLGKHDFEIRMDIRIYPGCAFMRQEHSVRKLEAPNTAPNTESDAVREPLTGALQLDNNNAQASASPSDYIDMIAISDLHCLWKAICLLDATDTNNNLVREEQGLFYPNEQKKLQGNIVTVSKVMKESGLFIVKESPTPIGHLHYTGGDFLIAGTRLFVTGSGISSEDLNSEEFIPFYGSAIGVFDGSEYGALQLIHNYHRSIRMYEPGRDCILMSNTWGDRSKDGRMSETYVLKELESAAQLGITHVQLDDGWQKGTTANSVHAGGVWGDYYGTMVDFWSVHPIRFPNGLEPIVERAALHGIRIGLWFSPDSSEDFRHWDTDARQIIELHRRYGVRQFKLDGIRIRSKRGEANLLKLIRKTVQETGGGVVFNLDTTAEVRLGYFRGVQYGTLFLENRYTDWGNYYPHWTLRNLWMLARWVPAQKLQMEFLNVARNKQNYGEDPLAPSNCGISYAFACTMFASLWRGWRLSGLGEADHAALRDVIRAFRTHQPRIASGHILPVGETPCGAGWTGLQSIVSERESYLLVMREWNTRSNYSFRLWNSTETIQAQLLFRGGGRKLDMEHTEDAKHPQVMNADHEGKFSVRIVEAVVVCGLPYSK